MGTVSLRASGIGALLIGGATKRTRFSFAKSDDGSSSPAPMREETRPKRSVRVVSAVKLVKQTAQCDEADRETNDHEPPSVDGSQNDGHECE
jgi:hypothetical protein